MKKLLFLIVSYLVLLLPTTSQAQLLSNDRDVGYPALGMWNGFNQQFNVVECSNYSLERLTVSLNLFRRTGALLGESTFDIKPRESYHVILNAFDIVDDYGVYRLSATAPAARTSLRCTTLIYRFAGPGAAVPITYGYAVPVVSPISGVSSGLFNSLNPVSESAPPAQNYLSVVNPGAQPFSGDIVLYDAAGTFLASVPVDALGTNQRVDIPLGHPSGKVVGLYRVQPDDASQGYYAFISVYAGSAPDFLYAYALQASKGDCSGEPLFASTVGPAYNWVQIANAGASPLTYSFEVRNFLGDFIYSEQRTLAAFAHEHILANSFLGDNTLGTVRATCTSGNLLLQSAFYGRTGVDSAISWGYANQARGLIAGTNELAVEPLNTFLGVQSWLRTTSASLPSSTFVTSTKVSQGDARQISAAAAFGGSTDIGLFTLAPADIVGTIASRPTAAADEITTELLRVFPRANGSIGYITLVPPALVSGTLPQVRLEALTGTFSSPVAFANAGDGTNRLFIVELEGRIRVISGGSAIATPFLDISDKVLSGGEQGLLGLAFHPNYESNGRFFVYYINNNGQSTVAEYHASGTSNVADANSERIMLTQDQPYTNHKAGQMAFGPDGFLYIGLGDGGSGGDPQNHAQNVGDILGDILRLDVNGAQPYAIPTDNPFVNVAGARPEIFAYGFRNPWRFSFDRLNGRLFVADVGQNTLEEIDLVTLGGNYGWRLMEGTLCFNPSVNCPTAGLTLPIHTYGRSDGISVIGGYVYRGDPTSPLYGKYVFGDFGSARIWTLEETSDGTWVRTELMRANFPISSFGEDESGELYVVDLNGTVNRLVQF